MTYYVQIYKDTDLNSPPISGQKGAAVVLLNACLVDGYSSNISISSITRSGSTATATVTVSDGLKLKTNQILTISGADGVDAGYYNGTFIITVTSTTTFTYSMSGTPSGSATGTPVGTLKLPITSITRGGLDNKTATVTMLNNNITLITGNWVTIDGCTGTGAAQYNGNFQITVTDVNKFTYQMSSDPGADATTTSAFYYKSGLQWTRPFAAETNSQTYISQATVGALGEEYIPRYLQVNDNGNPSGYFGEGSIYAAEIMTANNVFVGERFPTYAQLNNGLMIKKSLLENSTNRGWTLFGDEKTFVVTTVPGYYTYDYSSFSFGYFISYKNGDKYNTFIAGDPSFNRSPGDYSYSGAVNVAYLGAINSSGNNFYICRSASQIGNSIKSNMCGLTADNNRSINYSTYLPSPINLLNNSFYILPIYVSEGGTLRGKMPGIYQSLHGADALTNNNKIENVIGYPNKTFLAVNTGGFSRNTYFLVDLFGPWN